MSESECNCGKARHLSHAPHALNCSTRPPPGDVAGVTSSGTSSVSITTNAYQVPPEIQGRAMKVGEAVYVETCRDDLAEYAAYEVIWQEALAAGAKSQREKDARVVRGQFCLMLRSGETCTHPHCGEMEEIARAIEGGTAL